MKHIPTGENVSDALRKQIINLLEKYAGAHDSRRFNFSVIAGFVIQSDFAIYLTQNYDKLFGKIDPDYHITYYPLCMYCYYNKFHPNNAMFRLKSIGNNVRPTEEQVMEWFYKKHRDELLGLVEFDDDENHEADLPPRPVIHPEITFVGKEEFTRGFFAGQADVITRLKNIVNSTTDDLDEQDTEGHIWWGKFLQLIEKIEKKQ